MKAAEQRSREALKVLRHTADILLRSKSHPASAEAGELLQDLLVMPGNLRNLAEAIRQGKTVSLIDVLEELDDIRFGQYQPYEVELAEEQP